MELGKKFEAHLRENWKSSVPDSFLYRLNDQMSGYMGSTNVSDFIGYKKPNLFLIECKAHAGNTFPFSAFRQYDGLVQYSNIPGVHAGVILWMYDHDKVIWIPIQTFIELKNEGKKSFNIKLLESNDYEFLVLPSKKLRTFMDTDYSELINYYEVRND